MTIRTISNGDSNAAVRRLLNRRMARPALVGLLDAVRSGQSQVWTIFSDSTGVQDARTRWPYLVAQAMADYLGPLGGRVVFHQLRGTSEPTVYNIYRPILLAAGAGPRGAQFGSTGNPRSRQIAASNVLARAGDDLEVIVAFEPHAAAPAAIGIIGGQPGAGAIAATTPSTRGYHVSQQVSGNIRLTWWENGTGSAGSYADGASRYAEWTPGQLGVAPGSPRVIKFTLDVDNGAGGWTALAYPVTFANYYQTASVPASVAWGAGVAPTTTSPATITAVTTVNKSTAPMEIGARGNLTEPFYGTVYHLETHDGINGPSYHSPNIDDFIYAGTGANSATVGAPTLTIYNGAAAGKDFAWFAGSSGAQPLRPGRILQPGADLVTISTGHNEAARIGIDIKASMDTWITNVLSRSPMAGLHMILQNPQLDVASDGTGQYSTARLHAQRQREMASYARTRGFTVSDVYTAFVEDERWSAAGNVLMDSTNPAVHPSQTGYAVEASVVAADFGLTLAA